MSTVKSKIQNPVLVVTPKDEKQTQLLLPKDAETKAMDISSIIEKAEKLHLLRKKYEELQEKRKKLDLFAISHDCDNAQLQLADAKGLTFESANPKCIKQIIDIWKIDFNSAIQETENQMRNLMNI